MESREVRCRNEGTLSVVSLKSLPHGNSQWLFHGQETHRLARGSYFGDATLDISMKWPSLQSVLNRPG